MSTSFEFPRPNSMTASQAAKWYLSMIPLIPQIKIDEAYGNDDDEIMIDEFKANWAMKSRLRLAAALALYDQDLVADFFNKFPLPASDDFLNSVSDAQNIGKVCDLALSQLLQVTELERSAYPGSVGELIGMECTTADGVYVMTKDGWSKAVL